VEHEEADVPAALAQVGEQLQEMSLRAGDARNLLRVETMPSITGAPPREDATRPRLHRMTRGNGSRRRWPRIARIFDAERPKHTYPLGELLLVPAR
jgi:hypothetical protein